MIDVRVNQTIFDEHPTFRRGVVLAHAVKNDQENPCLESLLRHQVAAVQARPVDLEEDQRLADWATAHRKFGSNPRAFPPAHRSLLKRFSRPGAMPNHISSVITLMSLVSMKEVLPVGGDDLDLAAASSRVLELRHAKGNEKFSPLGKPQIVESPGKGEVIYASADVVLCRRWNWRNADVSKISKKTTALVMNVDAIGRGAEERAVRARDQVAALLAEFCSAETSVGLLSPEQRSLRLPAESLTAAR